MLAELALCHRVFEHWIDEVEAALGEQRWLLLTLDEFDRIDLAVTRKSLDARIFSLVRSLIQNHPRVAIALCGNFTPSERDGYRFQIPLIGHWMRAQRQPPGL